MGVKVTTGRFMAALIAALTLGLLAIMAVLGIGLFAD